MADPGRDPDRDAAQAVARLLQREPDSSPEVLGVEIVMTLRGLGWRPTEAGPAPGWQHGGASDEVKRMAIETLKQACAAADEKRARETASDG